MISHVRPLINFSRIGSHYVGPRWLLCAAAHDFCLAKSPVLGRGGRQGMRGTSRSFFPFFLPLPHHFVSRLSRPNVICTKGVSLAAAAPSFQLIKIDNGNSYGWAREGAVSSPGSELVETRMNVNAI